MPEEVSAQDTDEAQVDRPVRRVPGAAAIVAIVLLLLVSFAEWRGLVYPNYLAGALFQAAVLLLGVCWAVARVLGKPFDKLRAVSNVERPVGGRRGTDDLLLGAYAIYSAASCLWSDNLRLAAIGSLLVLFCVFWARGLGLLLRGRNDCRWIARAFVLAGMLASCVGIVYVIAHGRLAAVQFGMGHRNFLAIFLLPGLLLAAADLAGPILVRGTRRGPVLGWPLALTTSCAAISFAGLLLCKSVGGLLGLAAGVVCLLALKLSRGQRRVLLMLAVAGVVIGGVVLCSPAVTEKLLERYPSQATRWYLWQGTAQMIGDRPLFGWGAGMFPLRFADYKPTLPMKYGLLRNRTVHPHNELLLVAAEGGVVALLLYLAGIVLTVRNHLRASDAEADPARRLLGWAIFAGFAAMFVQGIVSVALRFWAPSVAYWTLIGMMLAYPKTTGASEPAPKREAKWLSLARLAAVLVLIAFPAVGIVWRGLQAEWLMAGGQRDKTLTVERRLGRLVLAECYSRYVPDHLMAIYDRARLLQKTGHIEPAIRTYEQLDRLAPGYGSIRRVLGGLHFRRAMDVGPADHDEGVRHLRAAARYLEAAIKQDPYDASVRLLMARALSVASKTHGEAALEHLRAAEDALAELERVGKEAPASLKEDIRRLKETLLKRRGPVP